MNDTDCGPSGAGYRRPEGEQNVVKVPPEVAAAFAPPRSAGSIITDATAALNTGRDVSDELLAELVAVRERQHDFWSAYREREQDAWDALCRTRELIRRASKRRRERGRA